MSQRLIRLVEVASELAGAKLGAGKGIESLRMNGRFEPL